jgi:hypothetical protein
LSEPTKATLVILGAGASAEAGVPTAVGMTDKLMEAARLNPQYFYEITGALRFVLGGLQFHQGKRNKDTASVDVETLLDALDLLEERRERELSAFVKWDEHIEVLERRFRSPAYDIAQELDRVLKDTIQKAREGPPTYGRFESTPSTHGLERALAAALQGGSEWHGGVFHAAKTQLLMELVKLTWIQDTEKCRYLQPIVSNPNVSTIVSLNYDNAIELAAGFAGTALDTGIAQWLEGTTSFESSSGGAKLLLKLHGSTNWLWRREFEVDKRDVFDTVADPTAKENYRRLPVVLFGGRVKLTARGPFLDMLMSFRSRLQASDQVVVIGYSFRDEHVNEYLTRWKATTKGSLKVVDLVRIDHPLLLGADFRQSLASVAIRGLFQ